MLNARFYITVASLAGLPAESIAEVAFAGRSNAGKSSAINALALHKRLAFVSKTPGRTQQLNFFQVGPSQFLVDLPGYGYARAPLAQQRAWQTLIAGYLEGRPQLKGLVIIMDVRHPFTELDEHMITWFRGTGKPIHILLSKADKLSRGEALLTLRKVQQKLERDGILGSVQLFSSLRHAGLDEAEGVVRSWLDLPRPSTTDPVDEGDVRTAG